MRNESLESVQEINAALLRHLGLQYHDRTPAVPTAR
jgi:hypothetical protein